MYLYFDKAGTLKEIISDLPTRVGSSERNKIYVYCEEEDFDGIWYTQKYPNGVVSAETPFTSNVERKQIPYNAKRDYKFFEDFKTYKFYVYPLSSANLAQSGLIKATVRIVDDSTIFALGMFTFNVENSVVENDSAITQSQYDYLIELVTKDQVIANTLAKNMVSKIEYYNEGENSRIANDYWTSGSYIGCAETDECNSNQSNLDGSAIPRAPFYIPSENVEEDVGFYFGKDGTHCGVIQVNISNCEYPTVFKICHKTGDDWIVDNYFTVCAKDINVNVICGIKDTTANYYCIAQDYAKTLSIDASNADLPPQEQVTPDVFEYKGFTKERFQINSIKCWKFSEIETGVYGMEDGYIKVTMLNGSVWSFPDFNYQSYLATAKDYLDQTKDAKDDAISAKNDAVSAKNDAVSAKNDAVSAKEDAQTAEANAHAWVTGNGSDGTTPGAENSAKYYSEQAEKWAQGGEEGEPQHNESAKDYAIFAQNEYARLINLGVGHSLEVSMNSSTYVCTFILKDTNGNTLSSETIDFPLETMVIGATYDDETKQLVLELKNGETVTVDISDIIDGLVTTANLTSVVDDLEDGTIPVGKAKLVLDTDNVYKSVATIISNALASYIPKANIDTSIPVTPLDTNVPSTKLVVDKFLQKDGYSAQAGVGFSDLADNLDSHLTIRNYLAYLGRTTAGGEEVANSCKVKGIIGGTLVPNQLVKAMNNVNWNSNYSTFSNGVATFTPTARYATLESTFGNYATGHKVLITFKIRSDTIHNTKYMYVWGFGTGSPTYSPGAQISITEANVWQQKYVIGTIPSTATSATNKIGIQENGTVFYSAYVKDFMCFDLTLMFGTTIANYISSLGSENGYAWFRRYFKKDYYDFKLPTIQNVKTTGRTNTGFNQFDLPTFVSTYGTDGVIGNGTLNSKKLWVNDCNYDGRIEVYKNGIIKSGSGFVYIVFNYTDGTNSYNSNTLLSSNATVVSSSGKIVSYINLLWTDTGNHDFSNAKMCISFYWDGERSGEYEDYEASTVAVEDTDIKGYPLIDANGNLYFDGDYYGNDGTIEENYNKIKFKDLEWTYDTYGDANVFKASYPSDAKYFNTSATLINVLSNKYPVVQTVISSYGTAASYDYSIILYASGGTNTIFVRDTSKGTDATYFKNSFTNDDYIQYPLATPTQSTGHTTFSEIQSSNNWGAEYWNDTREWAIPVSSDTDYLPDLKAKLESAPSNPDTDGDYVMHREGGENSYTSLTPFLSEVDTKFSDLIGGTLRQLLVVKTVASGGTLDFDDTSYVDLGDLSWDTVFGTAYSWGKVYDATITDINSSSNIPIISTKFDKASPNNTNPNDQSYLNCVYKLTNYTSKIAVVLPNVNYTSAQVKAVLKGVYFAYKKA